jgi:hypothetical protein
MVGGLSQEVLEIDNGGVVQWRAKEMYFDGKRSDFLFSKFTIRRGSVRFLPEGWSRYN